MNEIIDGEWCKNHRFKHQIINVAANDTYYYEDKRFFVSFTYSTIGTKTIYINNNVNSKKVEFVSQDPISIDDLKALYNIVKLNYPFNDEKI